MMKHIKYRLTTKPKIYPERYEALDESEKRDNLRISDQPYQDFIDRGSRALGAIITKETMTLLETMSEKVAP